MNRKTTNDRVNQNPNLTVLHTSVESPNTPRDLLSLTSSLQPWQPNGLRHPQTPKPPPLQIQLNQIPNFRPPATNLPIPACRADANVDESMHEALPDPLDSHTGSRSHPQKHQHAVAAAVVVVARRGPDSVQGKLFRHALTPPKKRCSHVGVVRLAGDLDEGLVTPAAAVGSLEGLLEELKLILRHSGSALGHGSRSGLGLRKATASPTMPGLEWRSGKRYDGLLADRTCTTSGSRAGRRE
jgi:hypothetical protein